MRRNRRCQRRNQVAVPGTESLLVVKPHVPVLEAVFSYLNICQTDAGLPVTKYNAQQAFAAQPKLPPSIQAKNREGALQAARQCEAALERLAPDGIENSRGTFASYRYRSLGGSL